VGVTVDTVPPALMVTSPSKQYSNNRVVGVAGKTEVGASVAINGVPADNIASDGSFVGNATLGEGPQTITVQAVDGASNMATVVKSITIDTVAPTVTISSPADRQTFTTPTLFVSGTVNEPSATVAIQGLVVAVTPTGGWSAYVQLLVGINTITVVATDPAGNPGTASITETYTPPDLITPLQQNITKLQNQIRDLQNTLTDLSSRLNNLTNQFKDLNTTLNNANTNVTNLQNGLNGAQNDIKGVKSDISGLSNVVLMGMALLIVLLLVGLLGMYMALSRKMNALHGVTKEEAEEELEEEEEEEEEQEEEELDEDEDKEKK
jgi:TolA-binding protein